jgi:hypothetical protein
VPLTKEQRVLQVALFMLSRSQLLPISSSLGLTNAGIRIGDRASFTERAMLFWTLSFPKPRSAAVFLFAHMSRERGVYRVRACTTVAPLLLLRCDSCETIRYDALRCDVVGWDGKGCGEGMVWSWHALYLCSSMLATGVV